MKEDAQSIEELEAEATKAIADSDYRLARQFYRLATLAAPDDLRLRYNLATASLLLNEHSDAAEQFSSILTIQPEHVSARLNLGVSMLRGGNAHGAVAQFKLLIEQDDSVADAHFNLGLAHHELGSLDEAIPSYKRAIDLEPRHADAYAAVGNVYKGLSNYGNARECYESALRINPQHHEANLNLGTLLLLLGDFYRGWRYFQHRLDRPDAAFVKGLMERKRSAVDAVVDGRLLLVLCEEGLGDCIQFSRYLRLLKELGFRLQILTPKPLIRLFRENLLIEDLGVVSTESELLQGTSMPIMNLPVFLGTRLETIPKYVPYLHIRRERSELWARRFESKSQRVGIAWRGSTSHANDKYRSIDLNLLLQAVPTEFDIFALNIDLTEKERIYLSRTTARNVSDELHDLCDTAELISTLDLVITVDTCVAHLAGALGKPTWLLLPFVPDWRWMLNRDDSPWYPTMRLYRQASKGAWAEVLHRMKLDLMNRLSHKAKDPNAQ
jgi:tetratricopeptide (TPR) repeat protein